MLKTLFNSALETEKLLFTLFYCILLYLFIFLSVQAFDVRITAETQTKYACCKLCIKQNIVRYQLNYTDSLKKHL